MYPSQRIKLGKDKHRIHRQVQREDELTAEAFTVIINSGMNITVSKYKLSESKPCFVNGTMEERLALVWPLTVEVVSLGNKYDPEQRLQRHIVRIFRRKG
jgi:propanediol dehydratase small subunit